MKRFIDTKQQVDSLFRMKGEDDFKRKYRVKLQYIRGEDGNSDQPASSSQPSSGNSFVLNTQIVDAP